MNDRPQAQTSPSAARRRLFICAGVLLALVALSGLWALLPLRELIDPREWLPRLAALSEHPAAPWAAIGAFLVGSLLALPVTVLVVPTVAVFGAVEGFVYALGGTMLSALAGFAIGRALGRRQLDRLAGSRLHGVSLKLRDAGITSIAAIRMFPLTHFTVVSLAAGVSHIRIRDFIAGTALGMAPGIAVIAVFFDQLSATAQRPSVEHLLWLAAISLLLFGVLLYARRLVRSR